MKALAMRDSWKKEMIFTPMMLTVWETRISVNFNWPNLSPSENLRAQNIRTIYTPTKAYLPQP